MTSHNRTAKYWVVKLSAFCGQQATVYTVYLEDEQTTLFDRFLTENKNEYEIELINIIGRIKSIGHSVGAREQYFKTKEGSPGDYVCALYDDPEANLRLYCIRYNKICILLGGGGPKQVRAWQDDPKLTEEAEWMKQVSKDIFERIDNGELKWSEDGYELIGDLKFNQDDEE